MPFPWHASQCPTCFLDQPIQIISGHAVICQKHIHNRVAEQVVQRRFAPALVHREFPGVLWLIRGSLKAKTTNENPIFIALSVEANSGMDSGDLAHPTAGGGPRRGAPVWHQYLERRVG